MVGEEDYYLKWDKHHAVLVSIFDHLYENGLLVDCTLAAEKKFIKAHRVVLMACSPYLEEILSSTYMDQYPIFFLDIKFSELEAIVQFCYRGEVRVTHDDLEGFLRAANMLQIRGLCIDQYPAKQQRLLSEREKGGVTSSNLKRKDYPCSGAVGSSGKVARRSVDEPFKVESQSVVNSGVAGDESAVNGRRGSGEFSSGVSGARATSLPHSTSNGGKTPGKLTNGVDNQRTVDGGLVLTDAVDQQGSDNSDVDSDDSSSAGDETEDETEGFQFGFMSSDGRAFNWICKHCGEAFMARSALKTHRITCIPPSGVEHPWKCDRCPNTYKNKKDLVRHGMYCGRELPRLECRLCGKSYKYERGLRRHQKYCGTEVKPLNCQDCGKSYKYKRGLRRHKQRCASSGAVKASAKVDESVATSPVSLDAAVQLAEPTSESSGGVTSCSSCGKSYKYRKSFVKHLDICIASSNMTTPQTSKDLKHEISDVKVITSTGNNENQQYDSISETKDKK